MAQGKQSPSNIPNSYQSMNWFVDDLMEYLSGEEYKCLSFAVRHIYGWHDRIAGRQAHISLSTFEDGFTTTAGKHFGGTGLSRPTVIKSLDNLCQIGVLSKVGQATEQGQRWTIEDSSNVNWDYLQSRIDEQKQRDSKRASSRKKKVVNDINQLTAFTTPSKPHLPPLVNDVYPYKHSIKHTPKNTVELPTNVGNSSPLALDASEPSDHIANTDEMVTPLDAANSPIGENEPVKKTRKKGATSVSSELDTQTHTQSAPNATEAAQTRKELQTATIFYFGLKPKDAGDWSFVQKMVNFFTGAHKKDKSAWYENQFTDKPMTAAEIAGYKLNRLKYAPTTPDKIFADASMWRMSDAYETDVKRGEVAVTDLMAGREPMLIKSMPTPEEALIVSKWWRSNNPGIEPKHKMHEPEHPIHIYNAQAKQLLEMNITVDNLGAFLGDLRDEAFWDGKLISWDYVFAHIAAWKVTHDFYNPPNPPDQEPPSEPISEEQRQKNLEEMAKIRSALTAKMTISAS